MGWNDHMNSRLAAIDARLTVLEATQIAAYGPDSRHSWLNELPRTTGSPIGTVQHRASNHAPS